MDMTAARALDARADDEDDGRALRAREKAEKDGGGVKEEEQKRNRSKTAARLCSFVLLEHWCWSWPRSA